MKRFRFFLAAALSILVAGASPSGAVSLYSGVLAKPTVLPSLPAELTSTVAPQDVAGLPAAARLPAFSVPQTIAPLAAPNALASRPQAAASLRSFQAAQAKGSRAEAALGQLFDEGHVRAAIDEYFGTGIAAEQAGVVVAKAQATIEGAPTADEMNEHVKTSPKTNRERENAAAALFARGGAAYDANTPAAQKVDLAKYDTVQFQDAGRGRRNVVVVKKGRTDRIIVVGSHNDKVDEGDGVIDNWTGTTMVAHLYQTLKDVPTEATIVFISHAREEEGLIGSQKFVSSLSQDELKRVESNLNIDTLAIKGGGTLVWDNGDNYASAMKMLDAADRAVAEENSKRPANDQLNLRREPLNGGDADSSSYRDAGVPWWATFFGGSEDLIFSIIHTPRDNFGAFSLPIYRESYFVTLAVLRWLDAHPVNAPRNS